MTEPRKIIVRQREIRKLIVTGRQMIVRSAVLPGPPGPPGEGDMSKVIYDPQDIQADAFKLEHHVGVLDAGTF